MDLWPLDYLLETKTDDACIARSSSFRTIAAVGPFLVPVERLVFSISHPRMAARQVIDLPSVRGENFDIHMQDPMNI